MPHALVLTTAAKANTTGGTFADTLSANSGDSLAVSNFVNGGARIVKGWGIDSDSVAEREFVHGHASILHRLSGGRERNDPAWRAVTVGHSFQCTASLGESDAGM